MAAKKEFDLVVLQIGSYNKYALPRAAAMAFFDACVGEQCYKLDSQWRSESDGGTLELAKAFALNELPTISALNPALFHVMTMNQQMLDDARTAERIAKAKAAKDAEAEEPL